MFVYGKISSSENSKVYNNGKEFNEYNIQRENVLKQISL